MPATSGLLQEGRYRIDHPIAENGGSSVFQAYDTVRDSKVVVKEIIVRLNKVTTLSQQENMKLAFVNQAKLLSEIRHDALVQVHDYFSEIGRQYLVLESLEGDDLQTLLDQNKRPFPLSDVNAWADQLLDALHYLHTFETPIIHKFVRPKNVRLLVDGKVKLLAHGSNGDSQLSTNIAEESNDAAVLNYSPLELIWDGLDSASQKVIVSSYDDRSERTLKSPADARSDIYSLGATLYHLLTARVPVDPLERSIEILEGSADPLTAPNKVDPQIPIEISDVVMRAMEIKRENRFDSAVIMRQVLRTAATRVQERDAAEARELEEAAEDLKFAEKVRQDQIQTLVEQKSREIEEEKRRQAEVLEQKLREAEELRLAAERRAIEAERLLREQEVQRAAFVAEPIKAKPVLEDDLLGLSEEVHTSSQPKPVVEKEPEPEVVAFEEKVSPQIVEEPEEEIAVVYEEPTAVEPEPVAFEEESVVVEEPVYETGAVQYSPEPDPVSYSHEDAEPSGKKLPIPMIAAAAVLIVVAVVGYFMFAGSSSKAPEVAQPTQTVEQTVTTPQTAEPQPNNEAALPSDPAADATLNSAQTDQVQPTDPAKPTAKPTPAKAAKPEPTKTPEKKKAVTVDDLINDN